MFLPFLLFFAASTGGNADVEQSLKRLTDVLAIVQDRAAEPVNTENALYEGAIPSMLRELDPHSVFFNPTQFQQLQEMEQSESKGFGTVVSVVPGRVIVLQALAGTPSARAGLSPGDEIIAINNIPLAAIPFEQLIPFLSEARQKEAHLIVRRPGSVRPLEFTLRPELMDAPTVERAFLLRPGIGYVRVSSFDPKTAFQLKHAIEQLGGAKLNGLVLDLRNNMGGVVQSALVTAALFLRPGQRILTARGRGMEKQAVDVPKEAEPYTFPLAVLVNEKTASAAEIVSGALQDHDRALIFGEPTYGKGLVQSVFPLHFNTGLALTTSFYYTPSGRSIQKPLRTGQLGDIAEHNTYRTDSGRKVLGGGGITPDHIIRPEEQSRLRVALDASGTITNFATEYLRTHKVSAEFVVTPQLLDRFQVYASERDITPPVGEWLRDREWIQGRLRAEIFNQALGVAKGDEVEMGMDPVVRAAVDSFATDLRAQGNVQR